MKISQINFPALPGYGLKAIQMKRLGKVVAIAGRNGCGKTRLLQRLAAFTTEKLPGLIGTREKLYQRTHPNGNLDAVLLSRLFPAHATSPTPMYDLVYSEPGNATIIPFVPNLLSLQDPGNVPLNSAIERSVAVEDIGVNRLNENVLSRIQTLQNAYFNATHPSIEIPEPRKQASIESYENLKKIIKKFLNTDLGRTIDGHAALFGFALGKANLSNGQKVLLQLCVAIHAQAGKLADVIILMDEPENHLHPQALLDVIEAIESALTNGQLWIATHSVPLLAHFQPEDIWWMEDGAIGHVGSKPERVLAGLVGDESRIARLHDFLGLPAALAGIRFAHQCLSAPQPVGATADDPQTTQISRLLSAHRKERQLRVVDFGAGRGRLADALRESGENTTSVTARWDYIAFDSDDTHRAECVAAIEQLYGVSENRYFQESTSLQTAIGSGSVDVIVMCNVLHEIPPSEWLTVFGPQGAIRQLLSDDGFLLLVEDEMLPVGEKAHQKGFLVLDTPQLYKLFDFGPDADGFIMDDARSDGRLKAHLIPKEILGRISKDSRSNALNLAKHTAAGEIRRLRGLPSTYPNGRLHAFHVQQLANTTLALADLE